MNSVELIVYYRMSTFNSGRGGPKAGVPGPPALAAEQLSSMSIDRLDSAVLTHDTTSNVKVRKYFPETWLWNSTIVGYRL
jgi:hypothetical protein